MIHLPWKWIGLFLMTWATGFVLALSFSFACIQTLSAPESLAWVLALLISFFLALAVLWIVGK
jgi:hypothetical protein